MEIKKKCNICKAKFLSVNMPSVPKFKQTLRQTLGIKNGPYSIHFSKMIMDLLVITIRFTIQHWHLTS